MRKRLWRALKSRKVKWLTFYMEELHIVVQCTWHVHKDGIFLNRNYFAHSSAHLLHLLILHCCFWSFSLFPVSKQLLQAKKMKDVCLKLKNMLFQYTWKKGWLTSMFLSFAETNNNKYFKQRVVCYMLHFLLVPVSFV